MDKVNIRSKFKLRVYDNSKVIDITITPRSISINGKRYVTENNFIELLHKLIEKYDKYYYK